jgi:hypothetical protein
VPLTSLSLLTPFLTGTGADADATGGKIVLRDAYVAIDGQDVSTFAHALSVEQDRDAIDVTGYTTATREYATGLTRLTFTLDLWADNQTQLPVTVRSGSGVLVEMAAHRPAPSAGNPLFGAVCMVSRYMPLGGSSGDGGGAALEFVATSDVLISEVPVVPVPVPVPPPGVTVVVPAIDGTGDAPAPAVTGDAASATVSVPALDGSGDLVTPIVTGGAAGATVGAAVMDGSGAFNAMSVVSGVVHAPSVVDTGDVPPPAVSP